MYTFRGIVTNGDGHARVLGFPTINIAFDAGFSGVWVGRVRVGEKKDYRAAVFADPIRHVLEAHLLDFSDDVYGEMVEITLQEKIRETKKFETDDELSAAIAADCVRVREYFEKDASV